MKILVINLKTDEREEKEVLSYSDNVIIEQAGKGKITTFINPEEFKIEIIEE